MKGPHPLAFVIWTSCVTLVQLCFLILVEADVKMLWVEQEMGLEVVIKKDVSCIFNLFS